METAAHHPESQTPAAQVQRKPGMASARCSPRLRPLFAILLLLLVPVLASRAAVRFDMFVGYDGLVPFGSWFPITFEVQNDGPAFVGTVEVVPGQFNSGQERIFKVELPTGTTKRFTVPAFSTATWNPAWSARLLDERRRVRAEAEGVNIRRFNATLLPVAAAFSRYVPVLPDSKGKQDNMRPVFGRLLPSLIPDNPLTLDGLDVLYLSSERALELNAGQVTAILAWLHGGGHLIVSLEQPNHFAGPGAWLAQLLPCKVLGLGTASPHSALQDWVSGTQRFDGKTYDFTASARNQQGQGAGYNPFARLAADPDFGNTPMQLAETEIRDGRVLVGNAERPLILTARRGLGQITALTFAPELEPFRSWKNSPYFWAKMVDLPPELLTVDYPNRYRGRPIDSIIGAMIDSRQIRKLPVGWLLLLLVAYLLVIGPLDQYWLKKLNRQMLTWLTFPAYVVFFSLLIYFIGYKLRAGETEWRELHIVDVLPRPGGVDFRGRSFGSIYSPVNARYAFANETAFATFRGEFAGNYGNSESTRGTVEQQPEGVTGDISVPVWTSQLFVSDWWQPEPSSPIAVEVTAREIRIAHQLEKPLSAAKLIVGGQVLELGEIPAGTSTTLERRNLTSTSLASFVSTHGRLFSTAANSRQQVFAGNAGGRLDDWTNTVVTVSFISRLDGSAGHESFNAPRGFDLQSAVDSGQAVLIAWARDHSPVKPINRFSARRTHRDTVYRVITRIEP